MNTDLEAPTPKQMMEFLDEMAEAAGVMRDQLSTARGNAVGTATRGQSLPRELEEAIRATHRLFEMMHHECRLLQRRIAYSQGLTVEGMGPAERGRRLLDL